MHFFRGDQRETLAQIETHLMSKHAARTGSGAVRLFHPMRVHMAHEIFVGCGDGVRGGQAHGREFKGLAFFSAASLHRSTQRIGINNRHILIHNN